MSVIVNRDTTLPEGHPFVTVFRHIRRDGPHHVGVGVAEWKQAPVGFDPDVVAEAHDVPEVHYVLSGTGVLYEEGEEFAVRAGDAIVTAAGRRHAMWATGTGPLVTIYVATGLAAFEVTPPET